MSLDGFTAGPQHEMDWIFEHTAPGEGAEEAMAATGAMLSGRHTYDVGQRSRRPGTSAAHGGAWSGAEFVLAHRDHDLEVLGTDITVQCLARGLVDEICVHVLPVLLGAGVPLYATEGMAPVNLEPIGAASFGSVDEPALPRAPLTGANGPISAQDQPAPAVVEDHPAEALELVRAEQALDAAQADRTRSPSRR